MARPTMLFSWKPIIFVSKLLPFVSIIPGFLTAWFGKEIVTAFLFSGKGFVGRNLIFQVILVSLYTLVFAILFSTFFSFLRRVFPGSSVRMQQKTAWVKYPVVGQILRSIFLFVLPIFVFFIINQTPPIEKVNQVIYEGSSNFAFIFVPLILFFLAYQRKGWLMNPYILVLLSIFYGLMLKWVWTSGYSNATQLWGYLPTSDAYSYNHEAYGLLVGNLLQENSSTRPIATLFFSSLLWISNLNPITYLWILAYFNVLGSFIASNEVRKTNGPLAAALFLTCGILFHLFYIGTMMTEQFGFLLGNLAFVCFWNGIKSKHRIKILLGLFLLSLGLNARAGAMVILFTLPVWVGFFFGRGKFSIKWACIGLLVSLSGFVINILAVKIFTPDNGTMFSNFGFTLYGVAVGNMGWQQILKDHPGVSVTESTGIAIQQILRDPLLFLNGVVNVYKDYFNPAGIWAFFYLRIQSIQVNIWIFVFCILGLGYIVKNYKKPLPLFLLFSLAGILLSVPFLPTRDVGYRTYTVTNPILCTLIFMGFPFIRSIWVKIRKPETEKTALSKDEEFEPVFSMIYPLQAVIIVLTVFLPFLLFNLKPLYQPPPRQSCKSDEISISFYTNFNAWVHVIEQDKNNQGISIPFATLESLTKIIKESRYHNRQMFTDSVAYAKPGNSIGYAPFYYSNNSQEFNFGFALLVMNTSELPKNSGMVQFCARDVAGKDVKTNYFNGKTFIASNLKSGCASCNSTGTIPKMAGMNSFGLIPLAIILIMDLVHSLGVSLSRRFPTTLV